MAINRVSNLKWLPSNETNYVFDPDSSYASRNISVALYGGIANTRTVLALTSTNDLLATATESRPHILFETSDPNNDTRSTATQLVNVYETASQLYTSNKMTYSELLLSAIIPDVKSFLNKSNEIIRLTETSCNNGSIGDDISLNDLAYNDFTFEGNKNLCGDLNVWGNTNIKGGLGVEGPFRAGDFHCGKLIADEWIETPSAFLCVIGSYYDANSRKHDDSNYGNDSQYGLIQILANLNTNGSIYAQKNISCTNLTAINNISCADTISCETISASGNIKCIELHGIAQKARWADLAELYESDKQYEPGTLVKFGGEKEITIADTEVNGVVSTKPGFVMNSDLKDGLPVALIGRVPIKVKGIVKKFDKLTLGEPGIAKVKNQEDDSIIGIALNDKEQEEIGLVECVTKFNI